MSFCLAEAALSVLVSSEISKEGIHLVYCWGLRCQSSWRWLMDHEWNRYSLFLCVFACGGRSHVHMACFVCRKNVGFVDTHTQVVLSSRFPVVLLCVCFDLLFSLFISSICLFPFVSNGCMSLTFPNLHAASHIFLSKSKRDLANSAKSFLHSTSQPTLNKPQTYQIEMKS